MWRGNLTCRKVLALIDKLPSHSAFAEASAQDDEVAEMYATQDPGEVVKPRIIEWTPERAELVRINEALQNLTALVLQVAGGKGEPPKPQPRPETAMDRLAARVETASYDALAELVAEATSRGRD